MARCREFNIDEALDQALNAFWLKGYAATSMTDLLAAMGLSKSSFYECFGSKREVLLAALNRYSARELAETRGHFRGADPVAPRLVAWLAHSLDPEAHRPSERCGCLIVNIAVELAPHDPVIEEGVRRHIDAIAALLAEVVTRAQSEGAIPATMNPAHAADTLLNMIAGLQILAKSGIEAARLKAIVDAHLDCLLAHRH